MIGGLSKKEFGLVVYGFLLIAYFGLSILSFWSNPIQSWIWFFDASVIIGGLVGGFVLYAIYVIKTDKRVPQHV